MDSYEGDFDLAFATDLEDELLQGRVEPAFDGVAAQVPQQAAQVRLEPLVVPADETELDDAFADSLESELPQAREEPAFGEMTAYS
ncbi:hypothetical protein AB4144_61750, partial [Rhizobiaceae sp. 2RAB30]